MRLSGMGRALELLLIPIRVLYEWIFSLTRLSDVYARKHSSRQKVERLVYYFRYMAMWSDSEIYLTIKSYVWTKAERETKKNKNAFKGNWHYWVCAMFWFISLSQTHVYWSIVSHSHSPFAQGSMGQLCIYLKWTDDGTGLVSSHIHNYREFINR
jgi:hypothetical protein